MTSKGLGEMFEGDSADTCAGKFPLVSMGGKRRVSRAQTREREPPSALAEFCLLSSLSCPAKAQLVNSCFYSIFGSWNLFKSVEVHSCLFIAVHLRDHSYIITSM